MTTLSIVTLLLSLLCPAQAAPNPGPGNNPEPRRLKRAGLTEFKEVATHVSLPHGTAHGRAQIFATKDEMRFLDGQGSFMRAISLTPRKGGKQWSNIQETRGGRFVGVNEVLDYNGADEAVKEGRFKMFDPSGNLLWAVKHKHYHLTPSPSGQSAVAESDPACGTCPLVVYGKDGVMREIPKPSRGHSLDYSNDGGLAALSTNDREKKKGFLTIFDRNWKQVWVKHVDGSVGDIGISDDGEHIGAIFSEINPARRQVRVFSNKGFLGLEHEVSRIGNYLFRFSDDGRRLLLAGTDNILYCFDLKARRLLWTYKSDLRGMFRAMAVTPDFKFVLLADSGYGEGDDYLHLVDSSRNGQVVVIEKMGVDYFMYRDGSLAPDIDISSDGSQLTVVSKNGIEVLGSPEAAK